MTFNPYRSVTASTNDGRPYLCDGHPPGTEVTPGVEQPRTEERGHASMGGDPPATQPVPDPHR
mgnify:CR=1 FL=1